MCVEAASPVRYGVAFPQRIQPLDFSFNPEHEADFKFFDGTLLDAVRSGDQHVHDFFRLLALCHTVMPDQKNGRLEYQVGELLSKQLLCVVKRRTRSIMTCLFVLGPITRRVGVGVRG